MDEKVVNSHLAEWDHLKPNQYCRLVVDRFGNHRWRNAAGQRHRVDASGVQDGPAAISQDGDQMWCLNGRLYRLDGPAVIYPDGSQEYWLDDVPMTQEQWAADPGVILYHSQTQLGAEEYLKRL